MKQIMNNKKKLVIAASFALILIVAIIIMNRTVSTNTIIFDGIKFENTTTTVENGVTTINADVINDTGSDYTLTNIDVIVDNNGELYTLYGYIGPVITNGEERKLTVSVDVEMNDINSIDYKINK